MDQELLRIFIGKKAEYYLNKWEKAEDPSKAFSWNWWAFIGGIVWMLYRKMYLYSLIFIFISIISSQLSGSIYLEIFFKLLVGAIGNSLYYRHAAKKIQNLKEPEKIKKAGGTHAFWLLILIGLIALIPITYILQYLFVRSIIFPNDMPFNSLSSPVNITKDRLKDNGQPANYPNIKISGKLYFGSENMVYVSDLNHKGKKEVFTYHNAQSIEILDYKPQYNSFLLRKRENYSDELLLIINGRTTSLFRTPTGNNNGQQLYSINSGYYSIETNSIYFSMENLAALEEVQGNLYKLEIKSKNLIPLKSIKGSIQSIEYSDSLNKLILNTAEAIPNSYKYNAIIYTYTPQTKNMKEIGRGFHPKLMKEGDTLLYIKSDSHKFTKHNIVKGKTEELDYNIKNISDFQISPDNNFIIGIDNESNQTSNKSVIISLKEHKVNEIDLYTQLDITPVEIISHLVWGN